MLLGYTPEMAQVAFRIGDSCTNIITPMMSFFDHRGNEEEQADQDNDTLDQRGLPQQIAGFAAENVSVFLITILGTIITEKVVEPRLGTYKGKLTGDVASQDVSEVEKKALKKASLTLLALVIGPRCQ